MITKTLKFILKSQIKSSKFIPKPGGFTLIELLVALVLAFLIITPLLGFVLDVMNTDAQEQAKANSEQEIQTALNYISRDLQQAIYIYDQTGITAISSQLRYPSDTTKIPLLVFWKRELVSNVVPAANSTTVSSTKDDTFVYSLVAYYLIKDSDATWSNAARIARWQIKDGVEQVSTGGVTCGTYSKKYVSTVYCPDSGFAPFNDYFAASDKLEAGMNKWKKSGTYDNNNTARVLIDYVDQTTTSPPTATCPPTTSTNTWSSITPSNSMTGFYVCVDRANTTAQVFIRSNALARINNNSSQINYSDSKKSYFSTASVRVQGRGYLYK